MSDIVKKFSWGHSAMIPYNETAEKLGLTAYVRIENYQFTQKMAENLKADNANLKAEVERLRKAGDYLSVSITIHSRHANCEARDEWLRAKKGLPSLAEQWEREKNNNDRAAKEGKPSV